MPSALEPLVARCAHCGAEVVIPEGLRVARSKKLAAKRQREERAMAKASQADRSRVQQKRRVLIVVAILAVTGGVAYGIAQLIESVPVTDDSVARRAAERRAKLIQRTQAAVQERISTSGCTVVEEVNFYQGGARSRPTMVAGGNCLELFVSSDGRARLDLTSPSGEKAAQTGAGTVVLTHCAKEVGAHTLEVHAEEFAQTIVECPHPRHAYKEDAVMTGLAYVQAELGKLEKRGCRKVLLVPDLAYGERTLSGDWRKGRKCPVTIAATGIEENLLTPVLKSPLNTDLPTPPAGTKLQVVTCPKTNGKHVLTIAPSTFDFYAVGSVDCPKRIAKELLSR